MSTLSARVEVPRGRMLAVVPAYNEADALPGVVRGLASRAPTFDVVVIDDGSTDATARVAAGLGVPVIRLPFNLGIGGAVQTGFVYAHEHDYDYMAQVDGDGQHEPAELAKLHDAMRADPSLDVICGSRFRPSDHDYSASLSRRTGIHLFAFALTRILGQEITDPTSGFRLYNRRAIRLFAGDYPHDYPEVEAMLLAHKNGLRLEEIPVRMHVRSTGRSSITRPASVYYMVKVSLALLAALLRRSPIADAGKPASVSTKP